MKQEVQLYQFKERDDEIVIAGIVYFQQILTGDDCPINENVLNCISVMVAHDQKDMLQRIPSLDELINVVFSYSPHSASRPYGMNC